MRDQPIRPISRSWVGGSGSGGPWGHRSPGIGDFRSRRPGSSAPMHARAVRHGIHRRTSALRIGTQWTATTPIRRFSATPDRPASHRSLERPPSHASTASRRHCRPRLDRRRPPPTEADPVTETIHGDDRRSFRWLSRSRRTPEGQGVDHHRARPHALGARRAAVPDPQVEAVGEAHDRGIGTKRRSRGNRYFYTKREGTQNQPVLYLREGFDRGTPTCCST